MFNRMVLLNVGWMENYQGVQKDKISGGGSFVATKGYGHEIFNFLPYNGYLYGYVQATHSINIDRLGAVPGSMSIDKVLVIWVSRARIIGWYKNATVYRKWQPAPSGSNRKFGGETFGYYIKTKKEDGTLLPIGERNFPIPRGRMGGGMGQSNVWYAEDRKDLKNDIFEYIKKRQSLKETKLPKAEKNLPLQSGPKNTSINNNFLRNSVLLEHKYWITTHWPPEIGDDIVYDIFLSDGLQKVGESINIGDRVWIYQSKGGRRIVRQHPDGTQYVKRRIRGRQGVIAFAGIVSPLHQIDIAPEQYQDGSKRWWCWKADGKLINQSGFVSRSKLNELLGHKANNPFHGFGDRKSGLKQITEDIHKTILEAFNENQPTETKFIKKESTQYPYHGHGKGGEGIVHKKLKEKIASNPQKVLCEVGLITLQLEYPFPTGDRIDILLKDTEGKYVTVEVEVDVNLNDLSGVLQAIKYRHMYALECRRRFEEIRSLLVAHNINNDVKNLCKEYGVETFIIDR